MIVGAEQGSQNARMNGALCSIFDKSGEAWPDLAQQKSFELPSPFYKSSLPLPTNRTNPDRCSFLKDYK